MLKFETEHRMSTLAEFLVDGIGTCWREHSYAFAGRALLPKTWMWQESRAIHEAAAFFMYKAVSSPTLWVSSVSSHFARFSVGEWW